MSSTELVSEIRMLVLEVRDLYRQLPDTIAHIAGLHAVSYDRVGSPSTGGVRVLGGDAAVMHGAGTDNGVTSSKSGDRSHAQDNHPDDPPSVLGVLCRIEDTWRAELKDGAADKTSINASVAYLIANVARAVQVLGMSDDVDSLNALRGRLRNVTGHTDTSKPSDAPCIDCNGRIVQRYGPKGIDDTRECHRCGKTYTPGQYMLAVKGRLEAVKLEAERRLTVAEARILYPGLTRDTIYNWENAKPPKIRSVGHNDKHHKLYLNADIRGALNLTTPVSFVGYDEPVQVVMPTGTDGV